MKLRSIKILARVYPIRWMDDDWADDSSLQGQCQGSYNHHRIKIARKSGDPMEVLFHEIGHSIVHQCQLIPDGCEEERIVTVLMEQLLGVLRENKINPLEDLDEHTC